MGQICPVPGGRERDGRVLDERMFVCYNIETNVLFGGDMEPSDLAQLFWLKREIRMEEGRIRQMERTQGDAAVLERIRNRQARSAAQLLALESYIDGIDDSFTRQIFVYRYACGMNWQEVARAMGGGNTADGVKKRCQRWLAAHP